MIYPPNEIDVLWACICRERSPFVHIAIDAAVVWLFEHGYAKEAARNSFRTMPKNYSIAAG